MYKDKEKQKEAVKKAVAKHRKGITSSGITGQGITPIIRFENGSYLHIDKLLPPKRALLVYLAENLKYPEGLRVGVFEPRVKECKKLLEVTAQ